LLIALLCAQYAQSDPYMPAQDAVVLERLPAVRETRALAPLRRALVNDPNDVSSALELARAYINIGRETSDPRFVSYAIATLAPFMKKATPPAEVLVLQATALQNLHRFEEALVLLDRSLALEPNNGQAWLTKATLLQVLGNFGEARSACRPLLRSADPLIALTCLATIDSLTGKLDSSYASLLRVAPLGSKIPTATDAWVIGQLAEMAERRDDAATAETHFKTALKLAPTDVYLLGAYSDLLLAQGRNAEVIQLLADKTSHDVLLLRLAIAGRRSHAADAQRWADTFDARRRAARPDDNPHLREHARFALDVLEQPSVALELARDNWRIQREPADVRVYARAARAAASPDDQRILREWLATTGFEDRTLAAVTP
jgi:tetratricopeptide (TPR) repeat protein